MYSLHRLVCVQPLCQEAVPVGFCCVGFGVLYCGSAMACPCALVLAVCSSRYVLCCRCSIPSHGSWLFVPQIPLVTAVVMQIRLRRGAGFRLVESLWTSRHVDVVFFDKTGTLTQGQLAVVVPSLSTEHVTLSRLSCKTNLIPLQKLSRNGLPTRNRSRLRL
jgi:hypothetical protein